MDSPRTGIAALFDRLGHLAVWNAAYVTSVVVAVGDLVDHRTSLLALGVAALTAQGAFLLDRVKLSEARLDDADRRADPARTRFLARHAALCDLPDESADREAGTRTVVTTFGARASWGLAIALPLATYGLLAATGRRLPEPGLAAGLLVAVVATTLALRWVPIRRLRHAVDLRLPLVVAALHLLVVR